MKEIWMSIKSTVAICLNMRFNSLKRLDHYWRIMEPTKRTHSKLGKFNSLTKEAKASSEWCLLFVTMFNCPWLILKLSRKIPLSAMQRSIKISFHHIYSLTKLAPKWMLQPQQRQLMGSNSRWCSPQMAYDRDHVKLLNQSMLTVSQPSGSQESTISSLWISAFESNHF